MIHKNSNHIAFDSKVYQISLVVVVNFHYSNHLFDSFFLNSCLTSSNIFYTMLFQYNLIRFQLLFLSIGLLVKEVNIETTDSIIAVVSTVIIAFYRYYI